MKKFIVFVVAAVLIALCFCAFRVDTIAEPEEILIDTKDGNQWKIINCKVLFFTCFSTDLTDDYIIAIF